MLKSRTSPLTFLLIIPCNPDRVNTNGASEVVVIESLVPFVGLLFIVVVSTIMLLAPGFLVVGSGAIPLLRSSEIWLIEERVSFTV